MSRPEGKSMDISTFRLSQALGSILVRRMEHGHIFGKQPSVEEVAIYGLHSDKIPRFYLADYSLPSACVLLIRQQLKQRMTS